MIVLPLSERPLQHVLEHLRERDRAELLVSGGTLDGVKEHLLRSGGNNFVFADDQGEPIAAGGWLPSAQPGVLWSWFVATPQLKRIGRSLHAFGLRMHAAFFGDGIRGIVTVCLLAHADQPAERDAVRWLERLGYSLNRDVVLHGDNNQALAVWIRKA